MGWILPRGMLFLRIGQPVFLGGAGVDPADAVTYACGAQPLGCAPHVFRLALRYETDRLYDWVPGCAAPL